MLKIMKAAGAASVLLVSGTAMAADSCGKITIADMNWSSASLLAHVDQFILNNGYGCDAELVPGDTMPTSTSMIEKGEPDIAPEMWSNSVKDMLDKAVADKLLRFAGKALSDGGEEGFWVPKYMVKKDPSLATIDGIIKNKSLFKHPEDPELNGFYTCPAGWNCQISAGNLFRALKLEDQDFEQIDPGSGSGLAASIAKAYERKEPWFGYYWAPTAVLGKYEMVKIDFGSGVNKEEFVSCTTKEDCLKPKVTMYPPSAVHTVTTESFAARAPAAYAYLGNRSVTNKDLNQLLAWMEDNQADGMVAAEHFLTKYPHIWKNWIPEPAARKVSHALKNL